MNGRKECLGRDLHSRDQQCPCARVRQIQFLQLSDRKRGLRGVFPFLIQTRIIQRALWVGLGHIEDVQVQDWGDGPATATASTVGSGEGCPALVM